MHTWLRPEAEQSLKRKEAPLSGLESTLVRDALSKEKAGTRFDRYKRLVEVLRIRVTRPVIAITSLGDLGRKYT
ncbi:uncharacterized protein N7503_002784 [Penicillium pulvis]|uniref:uncharacterized protein n=1 Tax=Penicillium pulvis TaxID=1562058 RepID=UPI002548F65A|nr:uncharacterized protein N7503_002784 [Penicillium pulvis]KAJ5810566.1 hypothetical protein N7503_002784 [Penicillium pulvis]